MFVALGQIASDAKTSILRLHIGQLKIFIIFGWSPSKVAVSC